MVERGTGPTGSPWSVAEPRAGHGEIGSFHGVPVLNVSSESSRALSSGTPGASISRADWRAVRGRGRKGCGINPRPTAKFGVGLRTIVAGASARRKQPGSEGVANRLFVGGNAGSAKTSPSAVGNSDVGIRGRIIVGPNLRQSPGVNTSPVTDFPMRFYAVVWRPTVGVEFPGLESLNDDLFLDGNAGVHQTAVCPPRKAIGKWSRFHLQVVVARPSPTRRRQALHPAVDLGLVGIQAAGNFTPLDPRLGAQHFEDVIVCDHLSSPSSVIMLIVWFVCSHRLIASSVQIRCDQVLRKVSADPSSDFFACFGLAAHNVCPT